ncbi:hypothetical protein [Mycolicibacterium pallens]|uniref:Uncharacterized protein n=1 Tax=Mycolicibacterium pallens TaxID=370524 RepID=A0ABX8VR52_9MYCO|nr:hypothetical protein [Mycolicibacterium pallens]APE16633.1 hypothetical protein BOH72_16695 [Mycobacterium sp. WY10]QYL17914.1 hypothetical protein K0O64_05010 [Mycolicibacterium pallens]
MDDDDFHQPAYPPSVLFGGAALVAVLGGIVAAVLIVSANSVDIHHVPPAPRTQQAAPAVRAPAAPAAPAAQNNLEVVVNRLTPQLPGLDRLLKEP